MQSFNGVLSGDALMAALEVLVKAGLAIACGGLIGLEREYQGRPAGVRTHMLMALGVLVFCEVSRAFSSGDESRIAANIVTGVGFLGAGTILRNGLEVRGLTTAASIWAVAAISMAVSVGGPFYWVALAGTLLTLLTLNVVRRVEIALAPRDRPHDLLLLVPSRTDVVAVIEHLTRGGARVLGVRADQDETGVRLKLGVTGDREKLLGLALSAPSVRSAEWAD